MASSSADIPFAAAQEMFPAGVVFDPDDEELVFYYLMGKEVYGFSDEGGFRFIRVINLYDCKPSMLSGLAAESGQDKMFFFTRLRKKYQNGRNVNRQAPGGFWKRTGPPSYVDGICGPVATKTSLVYYKKDHTTSTPVKTQWLMKEYMLLESELPIQNNKESQMFTPWTLSVVYQHKPAMEKER